MSGLLSAQTAERLVPLPVVLPMAAAALISALRKTLPRAVVDGLAIATSAAVLGIALLLLHASFAHTLVYWYGGWFPRGTMALGIVAVVDPLAAALVTLTALLCTLSFIFSWKYPDAAQNLLHPLLLIFLAGMCGFCLTGDLFNLFVFFELMSTAAFALCGLNTREKAPLQGTFNFAVTNTVAAFTVLTGIAILYAITGALNMAQIGLALGGRHDVLVLFAFALICAGFLTKAAIVPFHFWLPDAHAVAPTGVCVLFSGIMVELGLYAVLRLQAVVFSGALAPHAHAASMGFAVLGTLTALLGGVMCYAEHHLKRVLAFSTVSHAGLMLIAVGLRTPAATAGFLIYLLAHGLAKGGLFFLAGTLLHRLRSMSEPLLWRKGRGMPVLATLWFAGALALAAAPVFATAAGESLVSSAAEPAGLGWVSWIYVLGGGLTAAALFRIGAHTFFGWGTEPITDRNAEEDELPEDEDEDAGKIAWSRVLPPTICIALAGALLLVPMLPQRALEAGGRAFATAGYWHTVYTGRTTLAATQPEPLMHKEALEHGGLATLLALLLAASSVWRKRLPRLLRVGAWMEGPLRPLRAWQSGNPGDYVLWWTVGAAVFAAFAATVLAR